MAEMAIPSIKSAIIPASIVLLAFSPVSVSRAADDPRASQLTFEPWSKLCVGTRCFVGLGAKGACVPSGGRFSVETVKGKVARLVVNFNFGTRRKLEADISVQVDQDQPIHIPIRGYYRFGGRGELDIDDDFVELLKRSNSVTMEATTTDHERLTLSFSLADFAQAYDGPAIETPVLELTQEEIRQRAAQLRPLPQCED
jgi:invasion protein IalB